MMHHRDSISWKYFLLAWPSYIIVVEVLYKHFQVEICGFEYMGYTSQREIHGITTYTWQFLGRIHRKAKIDVTL